MAVGAAEVFSRMRPTHPVSNRRRLHMAAQTNAVGSVSRPRAEIDDFGYVAVAVHVQAPGAVTILALNASLRVKSMPEIFCHIAVARRATLRPNPRGARNFNILGERAIPILRLFLRYHRVGTPATHAKEYDRS
jgi:hypothetical protein